VERLLEHLIKMKGKVMKLNKQFMRKQIAFFTALLFLVAGSWSVSAQKEMDDKKLQLMQAKNESYMLDIHKIVDGYPKFTYEYIYDNGVLKQVKIVGIDSPYDRNRVATLMYDMRTNKDLMKNYCDTHGVFYAPENEAEPKIGYNEFREEIQNNLDYPENARSYGVEGTVYVKFIVDEDGNVTRMVADEAIDSPYANRVEALEEEALAAVEEVDAEWMPAMVDGDHVESYVVVPVTFDMKKDPSLPAMIR
jgi:TonB family protein